MKNYRRKVSMDPAIKTALGLCVLLVGVCAAQLFRNDRPQATTPEAKSEEHLLLRYRGDVPTTRPREAIQLSPNPCGSRETLCGTRPATVVTPLDHREPPPSLSPNYPEPDRPASLQRDTSRNMMLPIAAPADQAVRTHTVVDGDTLRALAERYLGSSARAEEIYQANRDVLSNPGLLPIGAELKLPPRNR